MIRVPKVAAAGGLFVLTVFGQTPAFLAADVRVNPNTVNNTVRFPTGRGEVFEARNISMADLISYAFDSNAAKVLGGPSWLEMDRFDIVAKMQPQTAVDQQRKMLRSLLAERFSLVAKEEMRPLPNYALTAPAKHKLKEADGSGDTGCKPQSSNAAAGPGTIRLMMSNADGGAPLELSLSDGMIEYRCRNMTMTSFVAGLRGMIGTNLGVNPITDQTGLSGVWNFDFKYSLGLIGLPGSAPGEQVSVVQAVEKQLGLKLEERPVPTAVVVVESANPQPIANPPGTAELLPAARLPKEFDVASIKPTGGEARGFNFQMQPGGRVTSAGVPLAFLISRAFNTSYNGQVAGVPSFADAARFDLSAQATLEGNQALDPETMAPLMMALLKERFGLKYHVEDRELPAYDLVAGKPKMTKADPAARSWCKAPQQVPGAAPAPQGSQALICQNITMEQFAKTLRGRGTDLQIPLRNLTGLEGGWDFRLTYNPLVGIALPRTADAPAAGAAGPTPIASTEPVAGVTIFEAVEKQLGLKLEKTKRTVSVSVVDHIDQAPSEN